MDKKKLIIIFCVLVVGLLVFLFYSNNENGGNKIKEQVLVSPDLTNVATHNLVLSKDGYKPEKISIKKGEAITFSTTEDNLFWPASNIHPSHSIYPEFDPKMPVEPSQTWSFIFSKNGVFEYHDHLNPIYRGVIEVSE